MKELIYSALGGALLLKDRVALEIEKLEKEGKLSNDEGKAFMERLKEKGQSGEEELKNKIKESIREVIDELGLATKADLEALKSSLK